MISHSLHYLKKQFSYYWWIPLLLWIMTMIGTPLGLIRYGDSVLPLLINLSVFLQFSISLVLLHETVGMKQVIKTALIILSITFISEMIGVKTAFPFGRYAYTDLLKPALFSVPILIPLAWFMMLIPSWSVVYIIMTISAKSKKNPYRMLFSLLSGAVFTAWDFYLDPQMVLWGVWHWAPVQGYYGIPWQNFVGWFILSGGIS